MALCCGVSAEKVLIYDEQKGIMFVDKDEKGNITPSPAEPEKKTQPEKETTSAPASSKQVITRTSSTDIHVGRKKDPPELYFSSGLEYFKNRDFNNALKNFSYADSVNPQARYALWKGKTYRQVGQPEKMLEVMQEILDKYPKSDVADDALFEIAFSYQTIDDYEKASNLYTQLAEQYPFGTSYSNGEEFREVAQQQRRYMRAEMVNLLTLLGYADDDLSTSYRKFQRANRLEVTGTGDRETVQAIKKMHAEYLEKENRKTNVQLQAKRYVLWGIIAGCLAFVNILIVIIVHVLANAKKRQLDLLKQSLQDLDIQKI
jgi:tetratricopeptide (TPR) repeat protein